MSETARIGLDNSLFSGRLRYASQSQPSRDSHQVPGPQPVIEPSAPVRHMPVQQHAPTQSNLAPPRVRAPAQFREVRPVQPAPTLARQPVQPVAQLQPRPATRPETITARYEAPVPQPVQPIAVQPQNNYIEEAIHDDEPSRFYVYIEKLKQVFGTVATTSGRYSMIQKTMVGVACLVFIIGLSVSLQTFHTNKSANAQIAALSQKTAATSASQTAGPVIEKISDAAMTQYSVAPDLVRFVKIPKLGLSARVMQAGVTANGTIGTPQNVNDVAWYDGSAKPGGLGATLLNAYVSSQAARGAFYGASQLVTGDNIQIVKGDNSIVNYRVVKTEVIAANAFNMQAAIQPVTAGKSGLNLVTITNNLRQNQQKTIVYAEQV